MTILAETNFVLKLLTVGAPYFVISEAENRTKKGTQNKDPNCKKNCIVN